MSSLTNPLVSWEYPNMVPDTILEGLTFDDVLLVPQRSDVLPNRSRYQNLRHPQNRAKYSDRQLGAWTP